MLNAQNDISFDDNGVPNQKLLGNDFITALKSHKFSGTTTKGEDVTFYYKAGYYFIKGLSVKLAVGDIWLPSNYDPKKSGRNAVGRVKNGTYTYGLMFFPKVRDNSYYIDVSISRKRIDGEGETSFTNVKLYVIKDNNIFDNSRGYSVITKSIYQQKIVPRHDGTYKIELIGSYGKNIHIESDAVYVQTSTGSVDHILKIKGNSCKELVGLKGKNNRNQNISSTLAKSNYKFGSGSPYNSYSFTMGKIHKLDIEESSYKISVLKSLPETIELSENGTIETYRVDQLVLSSETWVIKGTSTFDGKSYLFFPNDTLGYIKIDLTIDNPYLEHTNNYGTVLQIDGYNKVSQWSLRDMVSPFGVHYVTINASHPKEGTTMIPFHYKIENGTVKYVTYNKALIYNPIKETHDTYSLGNQQYKYNTSYYLENSEAYADVKKNEHMSDKNYEISFISNKGKKLWSYKDERFEKITAIDEAGEFLIIGGTTRIKGYRGYMNPYLQILNKKTGKLVTDYPMAYKHGGVSNIKVAEDGVIYITVGFHLDADNWDYRNKLKVYMIKDKLNVNGFFDADFFTNN